MGEEAKYNSDLYNHQEQEHEFEEEEEEEVETLSLSDLLLDKNDDDNKNEYSQQQQEEARRSSSLEPPEQFEFYSDSSTETMRSAEDIIFSGRLLPLANIHSEKSTNCSNSPQEHIKISPVYNRRCESLPAGLTQSKSLVDSKPLMRNSRSLDYRRLQQQKPFARERNLSSKKVDLPSKKVPKATQAGSTAKPRWYVLMFGALVNPQREMELKDIKSRQVRRNIPSIVFPHAPTLDDRSASSISRISISEKNNNDINTNNNSSSNNNSIYRKAKSSSGSCSLLRVLSCKDLASVVVRTPSFYSIPQQSRVS